MITRVVFILIFSFFFLGKSQPEISVSEPAETSEFLQLEEIPEDSLPSYDDLFTFGESIQNPQNFFILLNFDQELNHILQSFFVLQKLRGPPQLV